MLDYDDASIHTRHTDTHALHMQWVVTSNIISECTGSYASILSLAHPPQVWRETARGARSNFTF